MNRITHPGGGSNTQATLVKAMELLENSWGGRWGRMRCPSRSEFFEKLSEVNKPTFVYETFLLNFSFIT